MNSKNNQPLATVYVNRCVNCGNTDTIAVINDGGSIRYCNVCSRNFRAIIVTPSEISIMGQELRRNLETE